MKRLLLTLLLLPLTLLCANAKEHYYFSLLNKPYAAHFSPPKDWLLLEPQALEPSVSMLVAPKDNDHNPTWIKVASEAVDINLDEYVQIVRDINKESGIKLKELGTVDTLAGKAHLFQRDTKAPTGPVRQLHAILLRDGYAYVLTANADSKHFPKYYPIFVRAIGSLMVNPA